MAVKSLSYVRMELYLVQILVVVATIQTRHHTFFF